MQWCLSDAISKLERSQDKSGSAIEDGFQQMTSLQGSGGYQAVILTQLLGPLMVQTFGYKDFSILRNFFTRTPSTIV